MVATNMGRSEFDLAVIGGGINGVGIARDAIGRGLSVILVEQHDLASATSSASSKLVHGGLRYLEYGELRLVKESLRERERLLAIAPHLIRPMTFLLPVPADGGVRPNWMVALGLKLYDFLAGKDSTLPRSQKIELTTSARYSQGLAHGIRHGFTYSDCWVDDARLVLLNAMDARERGAVIRTRTRCTSMERDGGRWKISLQPLHGDTETVHAKAVVNAAGPWANELVKLAGVKTKGRIKRVQGSHIVVPRVHDGEHACLLQMPDKRVVFLLPFEREFTLIGTTDHAFDGDASRVEISEEEIHYLMDGANRFLAKPIRKEDIRWSYAGVRALYDDASDNLSAMTRDYVLELAEGDAPFLSVFGGKITTYRCLAESAMQVLQPFFPQLARNDGWTGKTPLPGGDGRPDKIRPTLGAKYGFVPEALMERWVRLYGTRIHDLLHHATSRDELGHEVVPGVFECELAYTQQHEWARTAEDFLWRRTKLGLHLDAEQQKRIASWFDANPL